MQPHDNTNPVENGSLFIHGYDVRIRVEVNHLIVSYVHFVDGLRRVTSYRFNRATGGLKRLIVSGDSGFITLAALRWLEEVGCTFLQVGYDGQIHAAFAPRGADYPAVRRWQALAAGERVGERITRELLRQKMVEQGELMEQRLGESAVFLAVLLRELEAAGGMGSLRLAESKMARAYWDVWKEVEVKFARRDARHIPEHWATFGSRVIAGGDAPRKANDPANAMLNYLYAILKGETTTALHAVGLDPGMGIMHADNPATDNLALDVMETARPLVDGWLLSFLERRVFSRKEFYEMKDGTVRMAGNLRKELSQVGDAAFSWVAPWAEYVRAELEKAFKGTSTFATPLTQANRKRVYRKPARKTHNPRVKNRCLSCGAITKPSAKSHGDALYCPACWPDRRAEIEKTFVEEAVVRLKEERELAQVRGEKFAAQSDDANRKRSETMRNRWALVREWETENPGKLESEKERFRVSIKPKLAAFSVGAIAGACGCSLRTASLIRAGAHTPHPVLYSELEKLVSGGKDNRDETTP